MTDTQHTPGPWTIAANMYGIGNMRVHGVEAKQGSVTQSIANCGWDDRGESAANARLIAAAPETAAERDKLKAINAELLTALREALDWNQADIDGLEDISPDMDMLEARRDVIQDAIAKAQP